MSLNANINIWTLGKGANGRWKLHYTTENMGEAIDWFKKLEAQGKQVALYELGVFDHEGNQTAGQVAFWWSPSLNEYMEREPEDRGVGWADGFDTWVTYSHPSSSDIETEMDLPAVTDAPVERYVDGACDHCGKILPMNQLKRLEHEVRVGRSSGTSRTSRSTSSRVSTRSTSNSFTFGSSGSSGRSYYKEEILVLCEECYDRQTQADRSIFRVISRMLGG